MKTLIIAEKPSLAKKIKDMLESKFNISFKDERNYFESDRYYLSNFFGHLLELYLPDDYGFKEWKASDLPILPDPFKYKYKGDTESRGKLLSKLASKCDLIVCATDPDREGEGIFRIWYKYENIKVPFNRFWTNSLAKDDLAKSWNNLLPSHKFDNLAAAQIMRQEADWLIGMNGSRAYSIAVNSRLSVGRVQTTVLGLIVNRDYEVEKYIESFFYSLIGQWSSLPFIYIHDSATKFENEANLQKIKTECDATNFELIKFDEQKKLQNPPMPFSLSDLQKVANVKFNFSLDKTLELTQSLYERDLVTYPRTSSSHLPVADLNAYYDAINKFADQNEKELLISKGFPVPCVQDTDSAHTAIIPTSVTAQNLNDDEQKLYTLILERFITAFLKPRIYMQYIIIISNGKHSFRSIVNKTIDKGFTKLSNEINDEEEQDIDNLEKEITIELSKESLSVSKHFENLILLKKKRSKPKCYTPATLLVAMMTCGKTCTNNEYKTILTEVEGIGTEATRQNVPVELEKRNYIEKSGKFLKSTMKGRQLIALVKPEIKSPELTAEWESKLKKIEKGEYNPSQFISEIRSFTQQIIVIDDSLKNQFLTVMNEAKRKCPKCNNPLTENKHGFFCTKECGFSLWKVFASKELSKKDIDLLFENGQTGVIDGFRKKDSTSTFLARVIIEKPDYIPKFSFDTSTDYHCPICNGVMKGFTTNCRCEKCGFSVWYTMSEKKLSETNIKALFSKGRTSLIKGFVSYKTGKEFEAVLYVDKEAKKVSFEFSSVKGK